MNNKIRPVLLFGVIITSFSLLTAQLTISEPMQAYLNSTSVEGKPSQLVKGINLVNTYIQKYGAMETRGGSEFYDCLKNILEGNPSFTTSTDIAICLLHIIFYEIYYYDRLPITMHDTIAYSIVNARFILTKVLQWKRKNHTIAILNIEQQLYEGVVAFDLVTNHLKDPHSALQKKAHQQIEENALLKNAIFIKVTKKK